MKRSLYLLFFIIFSLIIIPFPAKGFAAEQALNNEAGFIHLEPISFYFHHNSHFNRLELKSSQARIWYSFHASDKNSPKTPLLIFFNGGPGSATSSGLMSMYTSRYTLDNKIDSGGGNAFIPNPVPWTQLGHLLYIDARQAGFSYNVMNQVSDEGARFQEFNAQNFNPYFDAGDFIRVLLRFLDRYPELKDNPIVIVGESYGGVRATAMLHILLNYFDYGNGVELYQDPALVSEIQTHYNEVFPAYAGHVVPPEIITQQFGHQILIQPALSMGYQLDLTEELLERADSPLYDLGHEIGIAYDPNTYPDPLEYVRTTANRDVYMYTKPRNWLTGFFSNAGVLLRTVANLSLVTGVDITAISEFYATARTSAYRIFDTDYSAVAESQTVHPVTKALFVTPAQLEARQVLQEPGDMRWVFGSLLPWDRFFIGSNRHANWAFHIFNIAQFRGYEVHYREPRVGRMFLKNTAFVPTFITNAVFDLVVYTRALPPGLAKHIDILASAQHITQGSEARPGQIELTFLPSAFSDISGLTTKTIRFPAYKQSCHAVSLTQPHDFYADVYTWLKANGLKLQ